MYKMPIEKDDGSVTGLAGGIAWYYVDVNKKGSLTPSAKTLDDKDQVYPLNICIDQLHFV